MIRYNTKHHQGANRIILLFVLVCLGTTIMGPTTGWSHPSGMSLNLLLANDRVEYNVNDSIGAIGVIKNENEWPINISKGIREIELEKHLVATDPYGEKHIAVVEKQATEDMPPSSTWSGYDTVPADIIEPGFERSVEIIDLRNIFPGMRTIPGEWTVQAGITLTRFLYTVQTKTGIQGVEDRAWNGELQSNSLTIFIFPSSGARLKIRVEDLSRPEFKAIHQAEVRLFKRSDLESFGYTFAEVWQNLDPLLQGKTDKGGWVTLPRGATCIPYPEDGDAYVAIAGYKGKYKDAVFESGAEGWKPKCAGSLKREILFEEKPPEVQTFVVFGLNSVWLRSGVRIKSGDVGAYEDCSACNVDNFDVAIDSGVWVGDGSTIKGNKVDIGENASVWNVAYNHLSGNGHVRGVETTPVDLPVWNDVLNFFPRDNQFEEGIQDIDVMPEARETIPPESYGDITINNHAILYLDSGDSGPSVFQFNNLILNSYSALVCKGPTEIRISGKIISNEAKATYIGPSARSGYKAEDVVLFVKGENDAVSLGRASLIRANIFAKNGSLVSGPMSLLTGSYIAQDVTIGERSIVFYDGTFSEPIPGSEIVLTASARKKWWRCYTDLTWEGAGTTTVDVFRNGNLVKTTTNDGIYTDNVGWFKKGDYEYVICEHEEANDQGTSICSDPVTVSF